MSQEESSSWTDRITPHGDFRMRYESIDEQGLDQRDRSRYRARFGLDIDVSDNVKVTFQLCSGNNEPVSCNETYDNGFSSKDVSIDLAYIDWEVNEDVHVYGGKMKNPLFRAGSAPMIWDGDLNPEGAAVKYSSDRFFATLAVFSAEERSSSSDSVLYAGQVGVIVGLGEHSKLKTGIGYFGYTNTIGNKPFYLFLPLGNTVDINGNFIYEYKDTEVFAQFDTKMGNWPVQAFAQYAQNNEVSDGDTAYTVGVKVGAAKDKGKMQFGYTYMDIEADSVIGLFNDSDFGGASTNSSGSVINIKYGLSKKIALGGTFFINDVQRTIGPEHDYNRMLLDIEFKF